MSRWGEVMRLAAAQGGCVTRQQLIAMGVGVATVQRRIESGDFDIVAEGVYRLFPPDTHLDLLRGAVLTLPNAIVSHQSAAHLLELPQRPPLDATVTVVSHTTHRFPEVLVRRNDDIDPSQVAIVQDLPVTTVARTLFDLGGVLKFREFERVAESAILAHRLDLRDLDEIVIRLARRGKPGTRAVRDFVTARSGGSEEGSGLERRGRRLLATGHLPPRQSEYRIPWDPRRRFDDAFPEMKVAIEWDSREWHAQQNAMTSDRRRDREAAAHGWLVLRYTWLDVTQNPDEVVSSITTVLERRRKSA